jgi:hypothetical protein
MMLKHAVVITLLLAFTAAPCHAAEPSRGAWIPLFDGQTLDGWRASEHPDSFRVENGAIVCDGPRAHLFYEGDVGEADFRNFEFRASVRTQPGANSGIFFHTKFQDSGWPSRGYEAQVNNSYVGHGRYYEYKKTGSLYGVRNQFKSTVRDEEWFEMRVAVNGQRIRIWVEEKLLVDYVEPATPVRLERNAANRLSSGTFALQCHDPESKVWFKNLAVKPLPDDAVADVELPTVDETYAEILQLHQKNFPLVDMHVHLKGGLTIEEAMANSRRTGINYGVAVNCGVGFPTTDDAGVYRFMENMRDQPCFVAMQAEGREWVNLFSREAIEQFDYVFTDSMTFTDHRGKRVRLWIEDEVQIDDKQAFMGMLVDRTVEILNNEPIDIYVNPTFLPRQIATEYDQLWTDERMDRVIEAAVANGVAIEINSRYRLPSATFIKRAKSAGAKFSFGTNNSNRDLGRLEYCLEMIRECGLTPSDVFLPNRLK